MLKVNAILGFGSRRVATVTDTDAEAFFTATGITDATIKSAVSQLVIDLKAYGVWTKCKAIYPFVGGTAGTHSYNLRNTATFQITWNGGVTHNANGITPNGTTGYGNTGLNGSAQSLGSDSHLSTYSRTNSSGDKLEIGCYDGSQAFWAIKCRDTGGTVFVGTYRFTGDGFINPAVADSLGFFMESRAISTAATAYKNGSSIGTCGASTIAISNGNVCIGMRGTASPASFSDRNQAFASIGQGLTGTQAANFYTAVQAFQTTLGRQV